MTALYTSVELGLVRLLLPILKEGLGGESGGYCVMISTFGGDLDDPEHIQAALTRETPAILLQCVGASGERKDQAGTYYRTVNVEIVLIESSRRGRVAQREGSGIDGEPPGLYQMLEDVHDLVVNQIPIDEDGDALAADGWVFVSESFGHNLLKWQTARVSYRADISVVWPMVDRTALEDLEEAHGRGDDYVGSTKTYEGLEHILTEWP